MTSISSSLPITITPNDLVQSMVGGLTTDQASEATLESEISTGLAIQTPADNPEGAANMLQLQASVTRYNQYSTNATDATSWLQVGNSTMNSILSVLQSVQSVVEGVSGDALTGSPNAISAVTAQVQGALSQLQNLANTTYENGQPIFAGTGNSTEAYDSTGTYVGGGNAPTRTVAPGTQVSIAVTGPQVFGTGTSGLLSTVPGSLGVLAQIAQDLQTGTSQSLGAVTSTDLTNLQSAISTVENAAAVLGANADAVQGFANQATSTVTTLQSELGSVQDVNMAQAISSLQMQQTAYQAALWATSQLSSDQLVQYL